MPNNTVAGAPEEIRTPDPQIRSLVLYPAELSRVRQHPRYGVMLRRVSEISTGQRRDTSTPDKRKSLISLALPRGLEPLFSP
jgi:hypothetical protein